MLAVLLPGMNSKKILIAVLWLILAAVGAARIETVIGVRFDFVLASLVAFSFFMDAYEALCVSVVAILLVNWLPAVTLEMVLYPVASLIVVLVRRVFPLKLWLNAAVAAFLAILLFSLAVAYRAALASFPLVIMDGLAGALLAGLIFQCMSWIYHEEQVRRRT